jgi:hypothetical protein
MLVILALGRLRQGNHGLEASLDLVSKKNLLLFVNCCMRGNVKPPLEMTLLGTSWVHNREDTCK